MKRFVFPGLLALSLMGWMAFAAPRSTSTSSKKSTSTTHSISGTLVSSSDTSLVIKTKAGKEMTFVMNQKTTKPAQLKEGESLVVRYMSENGSEHAIKVVAHSTSAKSKKTSNKYREN